MRVRRLTVSSRRWRYLNRKMNDHFCIKNIALTVMERTSVTKNKVILTVKRRDVGALN